MIATVRFFNRSRAWGFGTPADKSSDIFLHASNLPMNRRYLNEGDVIEYELGERNGKPIALNIRIIQETPADVQPQELR
jgi:cold shock CspA family protein